VGLSAVASRGAVRPLLDSLPRPTTSFVGRGTERALVQALLERGRMVSLTGSPGCGKTRLAVEVARDVGVRYRDGVCFVALAEVGDPMLVPTAVASALHVREQPGRPLRVVLGDYLRPRRMLLILDGCERVADACARLAEDLLRRSADLRILATSRGLLRVAREVGVDVLPLAIPDRDASSVDSALRAEAARLFRDRALATREDFHLTDDHATGLRQICRRLSGIPLAIELTAVRTRDVSIDEIASRLDEPFSPLGDLDPADVPAALTLRAAMDFTYGLLSESERMLLRRLSVFAGGFTAAAAAAVCACGELDAERIGALLPSLVDKFLVMPVPGPGATVERYRLLDTVRDYAARTLADRHETVRCAIRHL
jgi:predicted ATPase